MPLSMVIAQTDPTGLSSPLGKIVIAAGMVATLVVLLRWWWQNRGK
ncbi:hypothetical protein [Longimycelium tulufanense]|nr:hypothetical protein [Longimycelium tulufanense]